jgi:hypothetical protein
MAAFGITNPCASGLQGNGDAVNTLYSTGDFSSFYGYPTYSVICPNKTITFDIWPPTITPTTFDTYFATCGTNEVVDFNPVSTKFTTIYPNPASDKTTFDFYLDKNSSVSLKVYDITGQEVYSISNQNVSTGFNYFTMPVHQLSNGLYMVKLIQDNNVVDYRKLTVAK